jgi:transposase
MVRESEFVQDANIDICTIQTTILHMRLQMRGKHRMIAHGVEEYVRESGDAHISGIEGFWSYAKIWLYHYRGVPKQYFHLYMKEIEFRFNNNREESI